MRCLCCVRGGGCAIHRAGGVLGHVCTHLPYAYYAGWSNCSAPHGPLAHSILQPVLEYYDCPHPADESYCARSWACCPYNITVTSTALEGLQPGAHTAPAYSSVVYRHFVVEVFGESFTPTYRAGCLAIGYSRVAGKPNSNGRLSGAHAWLGYGRPFDAKGVYIGKPGRCLGGKR